MKGKTTDRHHTEGQQTATGEGKPTPMGVASDITEHTGNPRDLLPTETQGSQVSRLPLIRSDAPPSQVTKGSAPALVKTFPLPQTSVPDVTSNTSQPPSSGEAQQRITVELDTTKDEDSQSSNAKKKPKKDRSKLRKGKWTVSQSMKFDTESFPVVAYVISPIRRTQPEEEEYTSRIIHYFSSGIFTLPEGTTLRAYLAEKLNCDPMRITKKYAGASCLGKRIYHLCDRTPATVTDVEVAKAELAQLEQRFQLRVELGQTGLPFPPRTEFLSGSSNVFAAAPGQLSALLQSLGSLNAAAPAAFPLAQSLQAPAQAPLGTPAAWPGVSLQFLAPNNIIQPAGQGFAVLS